MSHSVFISYARDASRAHAEALYAALGGAKDGLCFLDTEDIEPGEMFSERLVDALFDARVVVIFAEPVYFTRRYCLQEFQVTCAPFLNVADRPGASARKKEEALRGIVLALPPQGTDAMLERFPPRVQGRAWPKVEETSVLAALVRSELAAKPPTLRERCQAAGITDPDRELSLAAAQLPVPQRLGAIPAVPTLGRPVSIGDVFVGRADDVWRVHNVLTTRRGGSLATAAGLTGSIEAGGGFGKTRLAAEYLYRFGTRDFRGGLFWINAEQDAEPQLYEVLQALDPAAPPIEILRTAQHGVPGAVVRALLRLPADAPPPLFIIDNVPEPEPGQQPKPLETWCPALGEVAVLTTSRTQVALGSGGKVTAIPLDTLDPDAAVQLLTRDVTVAGALEQEDWRMIADWVGHLPLALELLNATLVAGALTPDDLLTATESPGTTKLLDEAMIALRGCVRPGTLRGVSEALTLSYERLTPEQQRAARLLAWMAPAPIPEAMLDELGSEVVSAETRTVLRSRSFLVGGEGNSFGSMHRVLADFLLSQSAEPDEEMKLIALALTRAVEVVWGTGDQGAQRVRACVAAITAILERVVAGDRDSTSVHYAFEFGNWLGGEFWRWGMLDAAEVFARKAFYLSETALGAEHPTTLRTMADLAIILAERGNLVGAQDLEERALEARRRTLGSEHPDTLVSMNNRALTLSVQGDYATAKELQEQVLEIRKRTLGEEHPDTLIAMNNLAITLRGLGNYVGAQALREQVLELGRRTLGEEHPYTLGAMHNLAVTLSDRGDFAGAQRVLERVLEVRRRLLGDKHPDTSMSAWNLVDVFDRSGQDATHLIDEHLRWLLERDLESLTATQRTIRGYLEAQVVPESHPPPRKPWWRFW
ncbi:MAG TPA: toll/interleukin-1 receptor domain-containing protein [Longimicrobiaceae bacterium]|nr:toll/interleukin-1 receptor domain-containing protein [Longimicrobiaceae bacterium]